MDYISLAKAATAATDHTVGNRNIPQPNPRPVPWPETCLICYKVFPSENARRGHMRVHGGTKSAGPGSGSGSGSYSDLFDSGVEVEDAWKVKGKRTKRDCGGLASTSTSASASASLDYSEFTDDEMLVAEALITLSGVSVDQTETRVNNNDTNNNVDNNKEDEICDELMNECDIKMKGIMLSEEKEDDDDDDDDDDDELVLQKYPVGSPLSPDYCYGSCSYSNSDSDKSLSPSSDPVSSANNCPMDCLPSTPFALDLNCLPSTPRSTLDCPNSWCETEKPVIKRKTTDSSSRQKKRSKGTTTVASGDHLKEHNESVTVADDCKEVTEVAAAQLEKRKWECDICNKTFPTHQALGGHKSSHRKEKVPKDGENKTSEEAFKHRCKICDQCFASGQALGGHQRLHYVPSSSSSSPPETTSEQVMNSLQTRHLDMVDDVIDLTLRL